MTDKVLEVMVGELDRAMDPANPEYSFDVDIYGRHRARPSFLSASLLERSNEVVCFTDGSPNPNESSNKRQTGLMLKALAGRNKLYGMSVYAIDEITAKASDVAPKMRARLPEVIHDAVVDYITRSTETFRCRSYGDRRGKFINMSADRVDEYLDGKVKKRPVPQHIKDMLLRWSSDMSATEHVNQASARITVQRTLRRFVDTQGRCIRDHETNNRISLYVDIKKDSDTITYPTSICPSSWRGVDRELQRYFEKCSKEVKLIASARKLVANSYPVILSPDAATYFVHEAVAHLFSGHHLKEGNTAVFKDRIGSRITKKFIDILAETASPGAGHYVHDAEGIKSRDEMLVSHGIFKGRLYDRDSAGYYRRPSNGHARHQWVSDEEEALLPISRAGNIRLVSRREMTHNDLMAKMFSDCRSTKRKCGLYIHGFSEAYVDLKKGSFVFKPTVGLRVTPDGRSYPVSNFVLIGSIYDSLDSIVATGDVYKSNAGMCDGCSGEVITQETAPAIYIRSMTALPMTGNVGIDEFL